MGAPLSHSVLSGRRARRLAPGVGQSVVASRKLTYYVLIVVLLGCLGKAGWGFYQTRLIDESMAPAVILAIVAGLETFVFFSLWFGL